MDLRQFLFLIAPTSGFIFTATPQQVGWTNTPHKSIESAITHINALTFEGKDAYFSLAGYEKARYHDTVADKWRQRTQQNARTIKSFFLDLDVEPGNPLKFDSKQQAIAELTAFGKKVGLPRPMVIDSGGGIHAYWPLAMEVDTAEWHPVAEQFKAICVHERFKADRSLTSDHARVLRALGSFNVKRRASVTLITPAARVLSFTDFATRIESYAAGHGVAATSKAASPSNTLAGQQAGAWTGDDNLGATNDPSNFDRISFHCAQLQQQVASRGAGIGEQLWRAGLGVAKFCEPQVKATHAISDGHPDFNPAATEQKVINWSTGPTKCSHFHELNPATCEACPHWQALTTPVQLGRTIVAAPAPTVTVAADNLAPVTITLPTPPTGYERRNDGSVCIKSEGKDGLPTFTTVSPYDLYPLSIRSQNGTDAQVDEHSAWRVHLPLKKGQPPEPRDFDVPLGLLADSRALAKLLYSKGIVLSGDQPKMTQMYMSAYLQKLAREAGRDKLYERLGWHDEHTTFVLGDRVIYADGTVQAHAPSDSIRVQTKGGLHPQGTLAGWQAAMQFYNRPGYEGHRFFIYASLGSPIFHMNDTGNKGVVFCAGGASGRGKTTCLKACSSIWGSPDALVTNGNKEGSTTNALYSTLGTVHSLPFILDDVTERDTDELRRFFLNVSQGEGKRRMQADGSMVGRIDTWANHTLMSTNADTITNVMAGGKDVDPHLMRLIAVEFGAIDTRADAKIAADNFLRGLAQNYGHVGPIFAAYLTKHYEKICRLYIKNVEKVDRLLASNNASAERYWSAGIAACYTAAQVAAAAKLIDFPFEDDLKWMIAHMKRQRESIRDSVLSPVEMLAQFLDAYQGSTLVVSPKGSTNLDNIMQHPHHELLVRVELDMNLIYVARGALMEYFATNRTPFRALEYQLQQSGVILKHQAQKVLGAETKYSRGQTRCWLIDATKLGGWTQAQPAPPAASNVVPITQARTA